MYGYVYRARDPARACAYPVLRLPEIHVDGYIHVVLWLPLHPYTGWVFPWLAKVINEDSTHNA